VIPGSWIDVANEHFNKDRNRMGRPCLNNADWFTHDTNLRSDRRIMAFRAKHGAEGYGIFQMLLEAMAGSERCWIEASDDELDMVAIDLQVDIQKLRAIIESLVDLRIFNNENGFLTCPMLDGAVAELFERRHRPLPDQRNAFLQTLDNTAQNKTSDEDLKKKRTQF
jgi:hypothetical protein